MPKWNKADIDAVREIVREAEMYLQGQVSAHFERDGSQKYLWMDFVSELQDAARGDDRIFNACTKLAYHEDDDTLVGTYWTDRAVQNGKPGTAGRITWTRKRA